MPEKNADSRIADLAQQIEALLFALGEPLSRSELLKIFGVGADALEEALEDARARALSERRGIRIADDGKMVELRAAPEAAGVIERVRKEEYSRDIGRAGLETLAAVLYRGPLSRSQVDFIRGVNSTQILRTLAMRGLVRKVTNPRDERSYLYEPTTELLAELGVARANDLPGFAELHEKMRSLEEADTARADGPASGAAAS